MAVLHDVGVLLSSEGLKELGGLDHLIQSSLYGKFFLCKSASAGEGLIKLDVKSGATTTTIHIPIEYVRVIVGVADLVQMGAHAGSSGPAALTAQDVATSLRSQLAKSGSSGNELPFNVIRSIYSTTPLGIVNQALDLLEADGVLVRQPDGKLVVA